MPFARGVDVSHDENGTDWQAVLDSGVSFGIVKATEGLHTPDNTFADNWRRMGEVGITRGAYHFFHGNEDGVQQAEFFLATIGELLSTDLPPAIDLEVSDGASREDYTEQVRAWIRTVRASTGRDDIIVYGNPSFLTDNVLPVLGDFPLWIAEYGVAAPRIPVPWTDWTFWQFSESEPTAGVPIRADADYFQGTHDDLVAKFGLG